MSVLVLVELTQALLDYVCCCRIAPMLLRRAEGTERSILVLHLRLHLVDDVGEEPFPDFPRLGDGNGDLL